MVISGDRGLFVGHGEGSSNPAGTYGLPGGRIEPYESPEQTAVRELFEDTGLISLPADLTRLGSYSIDVETKNGMEPWTIELYLCNRFEGEARQTDRWETPAWLRITDVGRWEIPNATNVSRISFSCNENSARTVLVAKMRFTRPEGIVRGYSRIAILIQSTRPPPLYLYRGSSQIV